MFYVRLWILTLNCTLHTTVSALERRWLGTWPTLWLAAVWLPLLVGAFNWVLIGVMGVLSADTWSVGYSGGMYMHMHHLTIMTVCLD